MGVEVHAHFYKSEAQGSNPAGYNNHFGHPSVRCPKPYRAITIYWVRSSTQIATVFPTSDSPIAAKSSLIWGWGRRRLSLYV